MLSNAARLWYPTAIISLLVMGFMSNDLFLPSMPELTQHFSSSASLIQNAVTMWFFGAMSTQIILGPLSDVYGRKKILLGSTIGLALASACCVLASSVSGFLAGRFLQGAAVSGIMVAAFASVYEVYEKENKSTQMLGIVGMCSALAPLTGPLIGGYIAAYFGWEANFYAVIATTIILYLVLACFMPEVGRDTVAKINWQTIWKHYQQLFSNRVFVASILSYSFLFFAGGAFLAAAPFIYVDILGLPVEWIGYGMAPMFICYMLASGLAGKLEQVASANALISTTLVGACILMLAFTAWSIYAPVNIWGIVIAVSIYYVALGIAGPPLNNLSLSQANDENKGTASALLTITMMLGSALGALLVSLVYNSTLFPIAAVITSGVVLAALVYLALA